MKAVTAIRMFAALLVLFSAASHAIAQTRVAGGYQFQRESVEGEDSNFPSGAGVDIEQSLASGWSLVGNIDLSRRTRTNDTSGQFDGVPFTGALTSTFTITTFAAGVRWAPLENAPTSPYAHVLVGGTRSSTAYGVEYTTGTGPLGDTSIVETDPMLQVGGGIRQRLSPGLNLLGGVDYRRLPERTIGITNIRHLQVHLLRLFIGAQVTLIP